MAVREDKFIAESANGADSIVIDGSDQDIFMNDVNNDQRVHIDGNSGRVDLTGNGASLRTKSDTNGSEILVGQGTGIIISGPNGNIKLQITPSGDVTFQNQAGERTVVIDPDSGTVTAFGSVQVRDANGDVTVLMEAETGDIHMKGSIKPL